MSPVAGTTSTNGRSVWADTFPEHERIAFPALERDLDVDVAIVGGGLTGLWTALHLLQRDPALRVAVVERDTVGFGASGRNGGWCSALLPMSLASVEAEHGAAAATRMQQAMLDNVHEVVAFGAGHGIGDACHLGGTISMARTQPQIDRLKARVAEMARFGFAGDYEWIGADEARRACNATDVLGAIRTRTCATVHPLRLTHAVARAADAAGARILEHTAVEQIAPRQLTTHGRHDPCRGRGARHRGLHGAVRRRAPGAAADLLADDRHRTARRRPCGTRSVLPSDRRSTTAAA